MNDDLQRRLWNRLLEETADDQRRMVRLAEIGCSELPTHKEAIVNTIGNWENRGFVDTYHARTRVRLTDCGATIEDPTEEEC